jgi:amino acid permease
MGDGNVGTGEVFTPMHTYFYYINSIMGSGFLAMPWAFQMSGNILTLIMLWVFTFLAYFYACILIEAMSRAEAISKLKELN